MVVPKICGQGEETTLRSIAFTHLPQGNKVGYLTVQPNKALIASARADRQTRLYTLQLVRTSPRKPFHTHTKGTASHLFFFCCRNIFLLLIIISCSFSSPSFSPSPIIAQVGCRCQGVDELSSPIANNFSISERDSEFLRSCLLATISTGTPWFSDILVILWSSVLASSIRSTSTESTTNTMPSVHRVYDFHSGLNFSWPPTSQKWKVTVLELPKVTLIFSVLNPLVGTVFTNSLNCSLYKTVVFPAQSKPRITIWKDWKEGRLDRMEVWSDSPFPISSCEWRPKPNRTRSS